MIRSMTGFGKGAFANDRIAVSVEIKSVNHRYSEIVIKAPRTLLFFENEIRRRISERLRRGKVDVFIKQEFTVAPDLLPELNLPLARAYVQVFEELRSTFAEVDGGIPLSLLAAQKDVVLLREGETPEEELRPVVEQALDRALAALERMRASEGEATRVDLEARLATLAELLTQIEERAPAVPGEWRQRLIDRLERLAADIAFDPQRVGQEVALFADRCDISEEIVRFKSHLEQFRSFLTTPEPVGRQMDFLTQELNREINTMGSKSNDAAMTRLVVALKAELEKIREQVQNIE